MRALTRTSSVVDMNRIHALRVCRSHADRPNRGAAAVEFAMVLPVLLVLATGVVELGTQATTANTLYASVGLAARLSTMNSSGGVEEGMTLNDKVIEDIQNYLTINGVSGNHATVSIVSEESSDYGQPFNLSDPNNQHRKFRITVQIPYSDTGLLLSFAAPTTLSASVVYQRSGGEIVQ